MRPVLDVSMEWAGMTFVRAARKGFSELWSGAGCGPLWQWTDSRQAQQLDTGVLSPAMRAKWMVIGLVVALCSAFLGAGSRENDAAYPTLFIERVTAVDKALEKALHTVDAQDPATENGRAIILASLHEARLAVKRADLWLRYLDPVGYRSINGPLPVEWESEAYEKNGRPHKRTGAGLILAELHMTDEEPPTREALRSLLAPAQEAVQRSRGLSAKLAQPDHFLFCERLQILNLAAIYTTGFECPDADRLVPELEALLSAGLEAHAAFNATYPSTPITPEHQRLYSAALEFVQAAPNDADAFDRYTFLRNHVAPLYRSVQDMIARYGVRSSSTVDYSLDPDERELFSKGLYRAQDGKGVFGQVKDAADLKRLEDLGRQLYFDPLLSGNGQRSCASCHSTTMAFTDTTRATPIAFDHQGTLDRNAPTLINADLNHLLMHDGRHPHLRAQAHAVITDTREMGGNMAEVIDRVQRSTDYINGFAPLLKYTPRLDGVGMHHILSAITYFYTQQSSGLSPFDRAMQGKEEVSQEVVHGFNLFMGKAECATCHFVPHFNGVKPPYGSNEFEVIGTPADTAYTALSEDRGRFDALPEPEMDHAFRTGGLRNIARTAPYMHNGVFRTLRQTIDHYNNGGGAGRGLDVPNQTLSSDSLHLSESEKLALEAFMISLNEDLPAVTLPGKLPACSADGMARRKVGGEY